MHLKGDIANMDVQQYVQHLLVREHVLAVADLLVSMDARTMVVKV